MDGENSLYKAKSQNNIETERLLVRAVKLAEEGKMQFKDWNQPELLRRSGKYRTFLHY